MNDETLADLLAKARRIADPIDRARRFTELIDDFGSATSLASDARRDALAEASVKGMTQVEIAKALGLTPARVNQMLKSRPGLPPDRALLAQDPGVPITIAVVEKEATDGGRPTIATATGAAFTKLRDLAATFDMTADQEPIGPPGFVDLNRPNLVVLMGPRVSSLIAQVIASDPVIQWKRDKRGHWYIVDTKTGSEFHSDFDGNWVADNDGERTCIAHVGRVRRPDGHGSFLYLGGAHVPGTAGAVDLFVREVATIWEQAKRSLWSAVVVTRAGEKGELVSADLATPIYVHGKR